jgi:hypothetical protein
MSGAGCAVADTRSACAHEEELPMPVRTHHAKWRGLVGAAPLIGIAMLGFARP